MGKILYRRCPGVVSETGRHKELLGTVMDGCWLHLSIREIDLQKGGAIRCVHCGGHMMESSLKGHENCKGRFSIARVDIGEDGDFDYKPYDIACCHNSECSKFYLKADAARTDARNDKGQLVHSGTEFIWHKNSGKWGQDSWEFGDDCGETDMETSEPRKDENGASWRRCLFCGSLLKLMRKHSGGRKIFRDRNDNTVSWNWWGPAATFRIYRQGEWEDANKTAAQAVGAK